MDTAGSLVVVLDLQGRIVRFNRACEQATGFSFAEVDGRPFWDVLLLPEEAEEVRGIFRNLATGRCPNAHENYWVARDGSRRLISWSNTALVDDSGSVEYVIGTGVDITERRRAEEALRQANAELEQRVRDRTADLLRLNRALAESEERSRLAFEHAAIGMALVGLDGRFLRANQALCEMLGYPEEQLLRRACQELTHPEDSEASLQLLQGLVTGDRGYGWLEKRFVRADGRAIWALLSTSLVRDSLGHPAYLVSQFQDITERKEAGDRLAEKEEQYRSIFEATSDGLAILDLAGAVVEANPAWRELHGCTYQELVGAHISSLLQPPDQRFLEEFLGTVGSGTAFRGRAGGVRKDGTLFHAEVNGTPFTYRGSPHILGVFRDVSERVEARRMLEERVAARTRELSALYDVTAVASASLNLQTVLERSLDRVLEVMRCQTGGIHLRDDAARSPRGALWRGAIPGSQGQIDALGRLAPVVDRVIHHGEPMVELDLWEDESKQTLAGSLQTVAVAYVGAPLRTKGQVLGVLSVVGGPGRAFGTEEVALLASIADQVGVAVENARLYERAERLAVMEERDRLARDLHDAVTQSLYSAGLIVETARRAYLAGDGEQTATSLKRLGEIVGDGLKEMRLLLYELRTPALERDSLVGALQKRLDAVERRAGVEAKLMVECDLDLPVAVEEGLYWIAQEALNNSLKHADASSVTVRMWEEWGGICLEVADDGIGLVLSAAERSGGLGLGSMRQRAERIGGVLEINSSPGSGARVTVTVSLGAQEDLNDRGHQNPDRC